MLDRALADLVGLRRSVAQFLDQLIQEQRDSVIDLSICRWWSRPFRDFRSAPADELVAICGDEFKTA